MRGTTSKLACALKLIDHGFRIFPISPNTKIPMKGFHWREESTTDKNIAAAWWAKVPDANIAIDTENLIVVDIDVAEGKRGLESMERLHAEGKILPPTTQQRTRSGGVHFIYKAPYPVSNSAGKIAEGIDIRATGGYVISHGSTIGKGSYEMDFRETTEAPEWLLSLIGKKAIQTPKTLPEGLKIDQEKAEKRALGYLNKLPPVPAGERNHAGYKTANRLKDFGVDREATFMLMMDYWKCEPMLDLTELQAVVNSAYKYGQSAQGTDSVEANFDEVKNEGGISPFERLNEQYAFVTMGSSHRIIHETTDEDTNYKLDHLNEETFHKKHANLLLQKSDGKSAPLTKEWMRHPLRRSYDGIVFSPGKDVDSRFYNIWRGFTYEPLKENEEPTFEMKRAWAKFTEHLLSNVVDGDIEHYNWVMNWFAHIVQKPWEKPGVALVMKGKKGVGKNSLLDCVGNLFAPHYMVTAKRRHVVGQFNAHMESLLFLVLDEAFWSGDKEHEGILKDLITGNDVEIERKGVDTYTMKSRLRVAIIGNDKWLVPASEDERRYAVFTVGDARIQDNEFFIELREDMEKGGYRYLLTKLLDWELNPTMVRKAPKTEGLQAQKEQSLSYVERYWFDALNKGYFEGVNAFDDGEWAPIIDLRTFVESLTNITRSRRSSTWFGSDITIMGEMKDLCSELVFKNDPTIKMILPTLERCRVLWDKKFKSKTKWGLDR